MGDGRYYTYYQFFDVLVMTILAVLAIASMAYCHYRKNRTSDILNIYTALGLIVTFAILRTIEAVIPAVDIALVLRNIEMGCLLMLYAILFFNRYVERWMKAGRTVFLCLVVLFFSGLQLFIQRGDFHDVVYTDVYQVFLAVEMAALIIGAAIELHKQKAFVEKRLLILRHVLLLIVPGLVYSLIVTAANPAVDYAEGMLLILMTAYIDVQFLTGHESSFTLLAFNKTGDVGLNYIFVVDSTYKLVYRNNAAKNAAFFKETECLYLSDVEAIFSGEAVRKSRYQQKDYIQFIEDGEEYYFSYKMTPMVEKDHNIGYIIAFTDVTDLMNLLNHLENKKLQSKSANEKLMNYSKVVYHIEKEKEINHLLEEVLSARESQLQHLSRLIAAAKDQLHDACFVRCIDEAIDQSNEILGDVRNTVTKYREYYG
ncbi:MAG: PAS domain-containing protein, partial [Clostridia bacterium]|nr:PAS domain-containing protein [Clostridia bacterium]